MIEKIIEKEKIRENERESQSDIRKNIKRREIGGRENGMHMTILDQLFKEKDGEKKIEHKIEGRDNNSTKKLTL